MKRRLRWIIFSVLGLIITIGIIFSACFSEYERLSDTAYYTTIDADHITLGGAPLLIPAYGELYITTPTTVNCTLAGTFYKVSGVTTSGELKGFSNSGLGRMIYTDVTGNRICLINSTLTVSASPPDVPTTISCRIYKNGVGDIPSTVLDLITAGDKIESLPITSLITLANTGDYLELYISSSKAGAVITIDTMAIVATTVD